MEFIKGYMDRGEYREKLCEMTQLIFGFTFDDWYNGGHFEGEYIPYSYLENGKIIANASANIMKMIQNGKEKLYIQIGTVMTRPEYRNKGLARMLIEKILDEYKEVADGYYLYGNLNAVGFYEKLGFCRLDQYRYSCSHASKNISGEVFTKAEKSDLSKYKQALYSAALNQRFDHINRCSLQLFYTADMEEVYYHSELYCFAVIAQEGDTLHLKSIISSKPIPIVEVLDRIPIEHETVLLGFTPNSEELPLFIAERYDGGEDYRFFYMGVDLEEIEREKLYFPEMSHA